MSESLDPPAFCTHCLCQSILSNSCHLCLHCEEKDGPAYDPQTPVKAKANAKDRLLAKRPKGRSIVSSARQNQKDIMADHRFRIVNKELRLPSDLKYCGVTLQFDGTEMCHIVPRKQKMDTQKLSLLEFLWGIPHKEFHIDSSRNMLRMSAYLHRTFDEGRWALVPYDTDILSTMLLLYEDLPTDPETLRNEYARLKFKKHDVYKGFDTKGFQYAVIPLSTPRLQMPIFRLKQPRSDHPPTHGEVDIHYFPYGDLPVLKLHIEPHYVIWNLGVKFKDQCLTADYLSFDLLRPLGKYREVLRNSLAIFAIWETFELPSWFQGEEGGDGGDHGNGNGGRGSNDNVSDKDPDDDGRKSKRRRTSRSSKGSDDGRRSASSGGFMADKAMDVDADQSSAFGEQDSSMSEESFDEDEDEVKDDYFEDIVSRVEGWRERIDVEIFSGTEEGSSALFPCDATVVSGVGYSGGTPVAPS